MDKNFFFAMKGSKKNLIAKQFKQFTALSTLFFLMFFSFFFGQYQKMDYKFESLIKESKTGKQSAAQISAFAKGLQLDEQLVVTRKGPQQMYSCIVYTTNAQLLRDNGFIVQSSLPKFVTVLATIDDLQRMANMEEIQSIVAPEFDGIHNDTSRIQSGASLLQSGVLNNTNYTGEGVLVGIYDSGIDWKHPDFRDPVDPTKSRIVSIWDQTLSPIGAETSPAGFSNGVEYTTSDINDELDGTPTNFVRENDTNGHGSHVSGTVAGNGAGSADARHRGFAPKAGIVFVKGGNGTFPQTNTIDALTYFRNVATALNKPIVVNMSIGGQTTAHDGTAAHEIAIDSFTTSGPGRAAVISAGNDYGENLHKSEIINPNSTATFQLNAGSNTTLDVFSFYLYGDNDNDMVAKLITPDNMEYVSPPSMTSNHSILNGNFNVVVYNWVSSANSKRYVQVVIKRNAGFTGNSQGIYKIELTNNGTTPTKMNGWKTSEGVATTVLNGDNVHSVGSPGNATTAITVAAYLGRVSWYKSNPTAGGYVTNGTQAENISSFSAEGPRADGFQKPDIAASGQNVISVMSSNALLAASSTDNVDGQYYRKNQGTSMSAPGVAGAVALLFQANPNLTAAQVKTKLTENARKDVATGNSTNTRWGSGKLDIYKTVASEVGCEVSESETIGYDEQFYLSSQDGNFVSTNTVFAVRHTPTMTGKIGLVNFFTGSGTPTNIPITIELRTVVAGNPGVLLASKTLSSLISDVQRSAWNSVDFSSFGIPVTTGEDFYVLINASGGTMSLRRENINLDNRSKFSTDNGVTWANSTYDYRIRTMVYEDKPQVKKLASQNESVTFSAAAGKNFAVTNCTMVAMLNKTASSTVVGNITAKVWVGSTEASYVSRRYEITPQNGAFTTSGRVTLYYYQSEFDAYNANNITKLPTSPNDDAGKANIVVDKFAGSSSDGSGNTNSYSNGVTTIAPTLENIKWNATYNYWEVTIDTTGFSGFFLRTNSSVLSVSDDNREEFSIYPNPVKDVFSLNLKAKSGTMKVFDRSGKLIATQFVNSSAKINVGHSVKGVYFVEITTTDGFKVTKKIIKE